MMALFHFTNLPLFFCIHPAWPRNFSHQQEQSMVFYFSACQVICAPPTPFCLDLGFVESQFHSLLGDACKSSKLVPTSTTSVYGRLTSGSALIHIGRRVMGSQRNSCVPRHFMPSRFRHGDRSMSPAGALTLLPTESLVLRLVLHFDGISLGGHAFFPWR